MRLQDSAHTSRPWRIHEIAPDFRVQDVWALPTPGDSGDFPRLVRLGATNDPSELNEQGKYVGDGSRGIVSRVSRALFELRWKLGDMLGWDDRDSGVGRRVATLRDRLPADLRDGRRGPDLDAVPMTSLYTPALMRALERDWSRKGRAPEQVRRVGITDPVAAARRYDYADAFEVRLDGPHPCSPEEWVRAGLDATPAWIKRVAGAKDGFGSARIVQSDADAVVLEDSDPVMVTLLVGRNVEGRRLFTTVLRYKRPLLARVFWSVVGILHRRTARRIVAAGLPGMHAPLGPQR